MKPRKEKITLTLSREMIELAQEEGNRLGISKSAVVAMALDKLFGESAKKKTTVSA